MATIIYSYSFSDPHAIICQLSLDFLVCLYIYVGSLFCMQIGIRRQPPFSTINSQVLKHKCSVCSLARFHLVSLSDAAFLDIVGYSCLAT